MLWLYILSLLVSITFVLSSDCYDMEICDQCTNKQSWNPFQHCRWCPVDNHCHAAGAIGTNPCKENQNIKYPKDCPNPFDPTFAYNETLAVKMFQFAAAAFQADPRQCFNNSKNYQIHQMITKTCDILGHSCFAFIAVSHTDRAIVLSYRGATSDVQMITELLQTLTKPKVLHAAGGAVQSYFSNAYNALSSAQNSVNELKKIYPQYDLWITGHSLGGAMASLAAMDAVYGNVWTKDKVKLVTFGMPRVGNYWYARAHDKYVPYSWRIVHAKDIVPHLPTCYQIPGVACIGWTKGPYHHGMEVWYENDMTPGKDQFKECHGPPFNEDHKCSNGQAPGIFSMDDHKEYFDKIVRSYCKGILV